MSRHHCVRQRDIVSFSVCTQSQGHLQGLRKEASWEEAKGKLEFLVHVTDAQVSKLLPNLYRNMGYLERKTE